MRIFTNGNENFTLQWQKRFKLFEKKIKINKYTELPSSMTLATGLLGNSTDSIALIPKHVLSLFSAGSVPIIIGGPNPFGPKSPLPFGHFIRWERALLWIPHEDGNLFKILSSIDNDTWVELRRNGRFILEHYLGNAKGICYDFRIATFADDWP